MLKKVFINCLFIGIVFSFQQGAFAQVQKIGETYEVSDKNIDWEKFDSTSIKAQNQISVTDLEGTWKAYKGVYRFDKYINGMNLTSPAIIQFKDSTCRRNKKSHFEAYKIQDNVLTMDQENISETGVINKLTDKELTISWKDGNNYTRYYYTK